MRSSSCSMVGFFCADSFFRGAFAGATLDAASGGAFRGVSVPSGAAARAEGAGDRTIAIIANQTYPPALCRAYAMLIALRPSQNGREFSGRARLSGGRKYRNYHPVICIYQRDMSLVGAPLLGGNHREGGTRVRVQFSHDAADVILDGALGEKQRVGDLPIAHALGDEPQDPLLLVVQSLRQSIVFLRSIHRIRHIFGRSRETPELIHDLARDLRCESRLAAPQSSDRVQQFLFGHGLELIPLRARTDPF